MQYRCLHGEPLPRSRLCHNPDHRTLFVRFYALFCSRPVSLLCYILGLPILVTSDGVLPLGADICRPDPEPSIIVFTHASGRMARYFSCGPKAATDLLNLYTKGIHISLMYKLNALKIYTKNYTYVQFIQET